ncbi:biopolymer transporter ExbD [Peredibacter sp. HCB2-198]|uniref:biopolymer transporter ExbD n=1 Tax=Peredibacter sp. HCB2-198 TaxID=3383025 RepID=UPI0038B4BD18
MLRVPTSRKRKKADEKLNLVPIMDSVFIFIFFLLMSASFLKIYEIGSPIPIISDQEPPKKEEKEPLALTMKVEANEITLSSGVPSREIKKFSRQSDGQFNFDEIHTTLIDLKKQHVDEDSIIFEPTDDLPYEEIVKIMDAVRMLNKTDEAIFKPNKDGVDEKIKNLFDRIIFSNLTT